LSILALTGYFLILDILFNFYTVFFNFSFAA